MANTYGEALKEISQNTGLKEETVLNLLEEGWLLWDIHENTNRAWVKEK